MDIIKSIRRNSANIITLSRIFLVFITAYLLFFKDNNDFYIACLAMTGVLMWFDGLDGFVARKLKVSSRFGALLDIMGDRIVENVFWITFAILGWILPVVPIIVLTRGIVVDTLRTLAFEKGFSAFGEKTMMKGKIAKFIVASNFSRFTYAVCKAVAFFFLILGNSPRSFAYQDTILNIGIVCTAIAVAFCVLRGLPVVIEAKRFFEEDE